MPNISTTKMSSKGQVVIPEDIRKQLNLKAGSKFVVVGEKDVVILKSIVYSYFAKDPSDHPDPDAILRDLKAAASHCPATEAHC